MQGFSLWNTVAKRLIYKPFGDGILSSNVWTERKNSSRNCFYIILLIPRYIVRKNQT